MSDATRSGWLDRLFGIDLRSLAAFRIAAGALVCVNALTRLPLARELYTDHGPTYLSPFPDTLFGLVGETWWVALWLSVLAVAGALLCVGRWTRIATAVCWLLLFDLCRRNPHVLDGGDHFLKLMLVWGFFLPLGGCWSLDARRASATNAGPTTSGRVVSVASAAMLLQPAMIYFFSAVLKIERDMWRDGTAAFYAVAQEIWARPFADWVAARAGPLTQGLTWATFAAEFFCPLLLFVPWKTTFARWIALGSLVAMQVGFAVSLELFLFPFVSTAAILPFLPSSFWDRVTGARPAAEPAVSAAPPSFAVRARQGVGVLAFVLAALLNLESVLPVPLMPGFVRKGAETVVAQGWGMYTEVYKWDFRILVQGLRTDGLRVPIDDGGETMSFAPIERLRGDYRAKMYIERLPGLEGEQAMFCTWVQRLWNEGDARPKIHAIELGIATSLNTLPGEAPRTGSKRLMVWPPQAVPAQAGDAAAR